MDRLSSTASLNEGRDLNPGDTCETGCPFCSNSTALNEGRDLNPGDTLTRDCALGRPNPLNEGRDLNPGDTPRSSSRSRTADPLNEGRDLNPGDTCWNGQTILAATNAQRRPGPESRRHFPLPAPMHTPCHRSTKAGT